MLDTYIMDIGRLPLKGLAALSAFISMGVMIYHLDKRTGLTDNVVFVAFYFAVMVTLLIYAYAEIMKKISKWIVLVYTVGLISLGLISDRYSFHDALIFTAGVIVLIFILYFVDVMKARQQKSKKPKSKR